jgi:hypothetical protein
MRVKKKFGHAFLIMLNQKIDLKKLRYSLMVNEGFPLFG